MLTLRTLFVELRNCFFVLKFQIFFLWLSRVYVFASPALFASGKARYCKMQNKSN